MKGGVRAAPALLALALLPAPALAHQSGLSYGTLSAKGDRLELTLRLSAAELAAAWPELALGPPGRGVVPEALAREVLRTVAVTQVRVACLVAAGAGRIEPPDAVLFTEELRCPRQGEPVTVRLGFVERMPPGHVHLAKLLLGGRVEERVVDARHLGFDVVAESSTSRQAARFVLLGIGHIFTGYDHIAFLIGLLLAGGALRDVIRVVSSFTLAHALTLALATLGLVTPPAALVEPLIAASVVYVALENLLDLWRKRARPGRRWRIAFGFGLVHGFGFAGALKELHLPGTGLATALFSFNLGVELGQAAIVAMAFPLLAQLRRRPGFAGAGLPAGSLTVGAAGLGWLVQRVAW